MSKSKKKKSLSIPPEKKSLQSSGSSRSVKIKIDGVQNSKIVIAGGNIAKNFDVKNINDESAIAGIDVSILNEQIGGLLDELNELIKNNLPQSLQSNIEDLQNIVSELKAQTSMSVEERNTTKIGRLLSGMSGYIGLSNLAVSQAEKAKYLFELIYKFLIR